MKKEYRIKKSSEIDAIFKKRQSKGDRFFAIYSEKNEDENHFRYALSIGKKYGNAVERNLIKRRVRHIVQSLKNQLTCARFIIVIKPAAKELTYQDMNHALQNLFKKLYLLETKHEKP